MDANYDGYKLLIITWRKKTYFLLPIYIWIILLKYDWKMHNCKQNLFFILVNFKVRAINPLICCRYVFIICILHFNIILYLTRNSGRYAPLFQFLIIFCSCFLQDTDLSRAWTLVYLVFFTQTKTWRLAEKNKITWICFIKCIWICNTLIPFHEYFWEYNSMLCKPNLKTYLLF